MKLKGFIHGIIPAFLLAISVGQIYAFTNFSSDISEYIDYSQRSVQIAFSLGIFFLGMGAAFFGKIVEKNIRISTLLGTALFIFGLLTTFVGIRSESLLTIYLGYGCFLGLGTGIIYISPVKTMMLWYPKHKALASALPIIFFGLGSTLSTFIYSKLIHVGVQNIFVYFALIYLVMMVIGIILLKKPDNYDHTELVGDPSFKYSTILKNRAFIHSWIFMFLNISSGLCLIPLAKQMMKSSDVGYSAAMITTIVALAGIFNGCGRFVFAFASDFMKNRINIIYYIISISILVMLLSLNPVLIGITLLVINACYGAGFSVIPAILTTKFGMINISKIHGAVLSAWGFAGLVGNQLAIFVSDKLGYGNKGVIYMLIGLYIIGMINFLLMKQAYEKE